MRTNASNGTSESVTGISGSSARSAWSYVSSDEARYSVERNESAIDNPAASTESYVRVAVPGYSEAVDISRSSVAYCVDYRMSVSVEASKIRVDSEIATGESRSVVIANDSEEESVYSGADRAINEAGAESSEDCSVGENPGSYSGRAGYIGVVDCSNESPPDDITSDAE